MVSNMMTRSSFRVAYGLAAWVVFFAVSGAFTGCQSVYYGTMEKFGVHKRDMLVERVEDAKDSQEEAKEQFASALEEFLSVTEYNGGDLQAQYEKLADELDLSEEKAREVRSRIDSIGTVADSLFREWESELDPVHESNPARLEREATRCHPAAL